MPCMIAVVMTLKTTTHMKNLWWVFNTLAKFRLDMITLIVSKDTICLFDWKKEELFRASLTGLTLISTLESILEMSVSIIHSFTSYGKQGNRSEVTSRTISQASRLRNSLHRAVSAVALPWIRAQFKHGFFLNSGFDLNFRVSGIWTSKILTLSGSISRWLPL